MSALDTWMPLYIADYLTATPDLTMEQSGCYVHLLMRYWVSGPLPDDDTKLAAICRMTRTHFARHVGPAIRPYFTARDGRLHQHRADAEREKRAKISEKRAENGRKSAEKSEKNSQNNSGSINDIKDVALANGHANAEQMPPTSTITVTDREERAELRSDAPIVAPLFPAEPLPARDRVWGEGLNTVIGLTGMPKPRCRALVGKWLKRMDDNCSGLLAILADAAEVRPIDAVPWIEAAVSNRLNRKGNGAKLAEEFGFEPDFMSIFTDPQPTPNVVTFPENRRLA